MLNWNSIQETADTLPPLEADLVASPAIPGAEWAVESSPAYGKAKFNALEPKQILVIDDDPAVRELVAVTVTMEGFQAHTAQDGEEGWRALCVTPYDLVITDHEMPRLTGLKLIERMRAVSIEPPCILISGRMPGTETALRAFIHRGSVLMKPFSASELIERVYGLLLTGEFQG